MSFLGNLVFIRKWLASLVENRGAGLILIWIGPAVISAWAALKEFSPEAAEVITPELAGQFIAALVVSIIAWALRKEKIDSKEANKKIQEAINTSTIPVILPVTGEVRPDGKTVAAVQLLAVQSHTTAPVIK